MSKKLLLTWAPIVLGILVIVTPYIISPVCSGLLELKSGKLVYMKCHYSAQAEILLGSILLLTGIIQAFFKKGKSALGLMMAILGLAIIIVPQQFMIGVCLSNDMSCRQTLLWLIGEGLAIMAVGLVIWKEYR